MERIRDVLNQYTDTDAPSPGRRQLNAVLPLEDFAKLQVLCNHYKVTKRRLGSDLLAAAVQEAYSQLTIHDPDDHFDMQYGHALASLHAEEEAR